MSCFPDKITYQKKRTGLLSSWPPVFWSYRMNNNPGSPFDSIESALEYMVLLESTIVEVSTELELGMQDSSAERTTQAYALALYKVRQLLSHTQKSRRILNDLRLIRAVMMGSSDASIEALGNEH